MNVTLKQRGEFRFGQPVHLDALCLRQRHDLGDRACPIRSIAQKDAFHAAVGAQQRLFHRVNAEDAA